MLSACDLAGSQISPSNERTPARRRRCGMEASGCKGNGALALKVCLVTKLNCATPRFLVRHSHVGEMRGMLCLMQLFGTGWERHINLRKT